jgi:hypothetical protein
MFPRINFAGKVQIDSATLNNVFDNFDINTFAPANKKITQENWNPSGSSNFRLVDVFVKRVCHKEGLCVYIKHNDRLIAAPITGILFTYRTGQNARRFECIAVCRIPPIPCDNLGTKCIRDSKQPPSHTHIATLFAVIGNSL